MSVFSLEAGSIRFYTDRSFPFSNIFSFLFFYLSVCSYFVVIHIFDPTVITERHVRQLCRHTRRIAQRALKFEWAAGSGGSAAAAMCKCINMSS